MHDKASPRGQLPARPRLLRQKGRAPLLILCDHASNVIPPELEALGLAQDHLGTHIAHDIGAAGVTRRLSALLDAPAIMATVSRLVIDLNRDPLSQNPFPETSDGITIPGNRALDAEARAARIARWFEPYHACIEQQLAQMMARGMRPVVIGLHSFTPVMNGAARPWQIGFLYDRDARLYERMAPPLRARGLMVGDNEPYSGRDLYYTMKRHGEAHGLLQATIEIRQDLIADEAGEAEWAGILAETLNPILQKGL